MARMAKHSTVSAGSGTERTVISPPRGREDHANLRRHGARNADQRKDRIAAEQNADDKARAAIKEGNDKVVIRQYLLEPTNVLTGAAPELSRR